MTAHIYRIAVDIFHSRSIFGRFKILKNNMARCSMFYGGVWEICCLSGCGVLLPTFFMSKSSVADLRRILSRIFEHQCHKDQTGQQLFVRVEQKNYTTTKDKLFETFQFVGVCCEDGRVGPKRKVSISPVFEMP